MIEKGILWKVNKQSKQLEKPKKDEALNNFKVNANFGVVYERCVC